MKKHVVKPPPPPEGGTVEEIIAKKINDKLFFNRSGESPFRGLEL
jgi:hypothetical protein